MTEGSPAQNAVMSMSASNLHRFQLQGRGGLQPAAQAWKILAMRVRDSGVVSGCSTKKETPHTREEAWGDPLTLPSQQDGSCIQGWHLHSGVAHLVVGPAGLPDAQGLGLRKLPLEAEKEPTVAEEHLEAVLTQGDQVLVEALMCQPEQLPQVQLGVGEWRGYYPGSGRACLPGPGRSILRMPSTPKAYTGSVRVSQTHQPASVSAYYWTPAPATPMCVCEHACMQVCDIECLLTVCLILF